MCLPLSYNFTFRKGKQMVLSIWVPGGIACKVTKLILYEVCFFDNLDIAALTIILHRFLYFGVICAIRICLAFTITS